MSSMQSVNLRSFRQKIRHTRSKMRRFLSRLEKSTDRDLDKKINSLEKEMWQQTDCLTCANCCKTMTPTFTHADIKRISTHFKMTPDAFKIKWLRRERGGDKDWLNKTEPCQFLDLRTNMCSIYAIRPADCAGFPHLSKKFREYAHVHKQNVELCPATNRLVEKMMLASGEWLVASRKEKIKL
ncbi:MAG TPA: YkgJ family cysteine cluster protein [Chitinophagaceae bacterium]|nr:YkgJ family cysteine cluster protein [Chitinophagaceae bacterium]